jgi:hypothetical protein
LDLGLANYLSGLALNYDPPNISHPSSYDYRELHWWWCESAYFMTTSFVSVIRVQVLKTQTWSLTALILGIFSKYVAWADGYGHQHCIWPVHSAPFIAALISVLNTV